MKSQTPKEKGGGEAASKENSQLSEKENIISTLNKCSFSDFVKSLEAARHSLYDST